MKVLFVSYGGGHIEMCLPVIRALRQVVEQCEVRLLALTTAFDVAKRAGESPLGYADFCNQADVKRALAYGEQLLHDQQHPTVSRQESLAYLGFNFLEWVRVEGESVAWERWRNIGRRGFLPLHFFDHVLRTEKPDVVVATNSPRSEQAALQAANALGIPSLSMVDLFALPGDPYLQRSHHATRIAVLAETTRHNLMVAGVDSSRIVVTGNPAFDALTLPPFVDGGSKWRRLLGWQDQHVIFWAGHLEPDDAQPLDWAGSGLGQLVQDRLVQWVLARNDVCLAVRYHPNEWHKFARPPAHPRVHWSQPDQTALMPVLAGCDQVVVQATTVGLQASKAGKRVVSLPFSPTVKHSGLDYAQLGISVGANSLEHIVPVLEQGIGMVASHQSSDTADSSAAMAVALLIANLAVGATQSTAI